MNEKLRPCPFCGEKRKDWLELEGPARGRWIKCGHCGAIGPDRGSVTQWNNRPGEDKATALLAALLNEYNLLAERHCFGRTNESGDSVEANVEAFLAEVQPKAAER